MSFLSSIQAATTTTASAATATAAAPAAQNPNAMFNTLAMVAVFGLFIYFLLWRPQTKRVREQRELLSSVKAGDEVVTASGILGKVEAISDNIIDLAITANTTVKMQKNSIVAVLPKGTIK